MIEWFAQLDRNMSLLLLCAVLLMAYIVVRFVLKITERALGCLATALIALGVLLILWLVYYWLLPIL
jgi:uncharacterized membrane protein required for colicin V production